LPDGPLVSFGLAGALVPGLEPGQLVTAERIVDEDGRTLWEGRPLPVPGARPVVLCSVSGVIDVPEARASLAARAGAGAVDMESGPVAGSGRLVGAVRAVSDSSSRPVGRLARVAKDDGGVDIIRLVAAFAAEPLSGLRAAWAARAAFRALERAAASLAAGTELGTGRSARAP
jgi:adenosylhomocysteine nucleosidase